MTDTKENDITPIQQSIQIDYVDIAATCVEEGYDEEVVFTSPDVPLSVFTIHDVELGEEEKTQKKEQNQVSTEAAQNDLSRHSPLPSLYSIAEEKLDLPAADAQRNATVTKTPSTSWYHSFRARLRRPYTHFDLPPDTPLAERCEIELEQVNQNRLPIWFLMFVILVSGEVHAFSMYSSGVSFKY